MANLIITILAILLIAIAAIMGVFYGGKAFQESSAKGYAGSITNVLKQFDGAGKYWQLEQNGGANIHGNYTPAQLNALLYPRYISAPADGQTTQVAFYIGSTLENGVFYLTNDTLSETNSGVKLTKTSCRAMEFLRRGVMPEELRVIGNLGTDNLNEKFCGQVGCVANEDSGITGSYIAYWRAYGKPDSDKSECVDDGSGTGDTSGFSEEGVVGSPSPGPGPSPTPGPSPSPTPGPTPSPTPGPSPSPSPSPSPTPGPSPSPSPGPVLPEEAEEAIPTPTPSPAPAPSPSPSPVPAPILP